MQSPSLETRSREELIELCRLYAKNFLALDGVWFQSVEKKYGLDEALFHDAEAWRRYTETEARRLKAFLRLPERAGIEGLKQALSLRFNSLVNRDEIVMPDDRTLIYRVVDCRVQTARQRKGMACHPCKPVGLIEYAYFARCIDDRFETEVVSCHPDVTDPGCNCCWRFTLHETPGTENAEE